MAGIDGCRAAAQRTRVSFHRRAPVPAAACGMGGGPRAPSAATARRHRPEFRTIGTGCAFTPASSGSSTKNQGLFTDWAALQQC